MQKLKDQYIETDQNAIVIQNNVKSQIKNNIKYIPPKPLKQKNDKDRTFFMGYLMLKYSLNATSAVLDNKWAQKLYDQHQGPLEEIVDMLYHEKKKVKA